MRFPRPRFRLAFLMLLITGSAIGIGVVRDQPYRANRRLWATHEAGCRKHLAQARMRREFCLAQPPDSPHQPATEEGLSQLVAVNGTVRPYRTWSEEVDFLDKDIAGTTIMADHAGRERSINQRRLIFPF